jgi:hypothetical protein
MADLLAHGREAQLSTSRLATGQSVLYPSGRTGDRKMYYPIDELDQPGYFTLQDADRFHCILHSGEVTLADKTAMVLVIFVIRRTAAERFDIFIVTKFFRPDGSTNKTMMSKKSIAPADLEKVISDTSGTFALGLKLQGRIDIERDKLDLRKVTAKDE